MALKLLPAVRRSVDWRLGRAAACGLALFAAIGPAGGAQAQPDAQTQSIARGQALAQRNCAMCHSVGSEGASPRASAPPFRDLHKRFALDDLEAGILSDLLVGHPAMPEIRLRPAEVRDLLAYLRSLSTERRAEGPSGSTARARALLGPGVVGGAGSAPEAR
jgi:cytochrome c